MTDVAESIAAELDAAVAAARERQRTERRLAEADELEREVSLYRAGVPLHTSVGEMFMATYAGPLDDPDAIQAAWFEATDQPVPRDVAQRLTAKCIADELRTATKENK